MNNSNFHTFSDSESSGNLESELETDETPYSSDSSHEYYDKNLSECSSNCDENKVSINIRKLKNYNKNIEVFESETQSDYFESFSETESDSNTEEEIVLKKGFFTKIKNIIKEEQKKEQETKKEEESNKEEETNINLNDVSLNIIKDTQKENWQKLNYETITKDNFELVIVTSNDL
tara:strand:+ start:22679 stop:23206 length:528 start_codon:yes stop_codon:yes gene_type:complete